MYQIISRGLALSGMVMAGIALSAYIYTVSLPYHISLLQESRMILAINVQTVSALLGVSSGLAASIIGRRSGLSGRVARTTAIIFEVMVLLLVVTTCSLHSTSLYLN